jgi:ribose transport system ATP-binding protein
MSDASPLLQMEHITKSYPGVKALKEVDFEVVSGEIHALVGENGAGKSTLMKVLTGAQLPDSGRITWKGQPVSINTPGDAQALGISMIHQELSLIPHLTVGQNIFLGREFGAGGFINWPTLYNEAQKLLDRLNMTVDARTEIRFLSIAQQQMVEVAKALSLNADLIAMDEPTSSLTDVETEVLFRVMRSLKDEGVSLVFISHRLEEVFEISDRITTLRDGEFVGTREAAHLTEGEVVNMMVGRELGELYPDANRTRQGMLLQTTNLKDGKELKGIDLTLYKGEILGIAGLVGAGRTALAETIFGIRRAVEGEIKIDGKLTKINSPGKAISLGIGLVPEDRKLQGVFLNLAVKNNIYISAMNQITVWGFINIRKARTLAQSFVEKLGVRTPGLGQRIRNLSGGNQQKVVIARWLTLNPRLLILDEPTRGIDIGAKAEIHNLMSDLATQGMCVLMISSELPEVLNVSDRILVMHEGRVTAEFSRDEATQDKLMVAATGGLSRGENSNEE